MWTKVSSVKAGKYIQSWKQLKKDDLNEAPVSSLLYLPAEHAGEDDVEEQVLSQQEYLVVPKVYYPH